MRIGLYKSNFGGSPLLHNLRKGFKNINVLAEDVVLSRHYDYVLIFNQTAHSKDYYYHDLRQITNKYPKLAFVDTAEYGFKSRLIKNIKMYKNAFTDFALEHDTKKVNQQRMLFNYLHGKSFPYFLREYYKNINYPKCYHPIDYPLSLPCKNCPNENQYNNRKFPVFAVWGQSNPIRKDIIKEIRNEMPSPEVRMFDNKSRIPQNIFLTKMHNSKISVSYDGYGSSSFREMEILCRSMLLKGEMVIKQRNPLINGVHFVEYKVAITEDGTFINTNIKELINYYLNNPKEAFEIYKKGYEHCYKYYTPKATAQYILNVLQSHDYSTITPLLVQDPIKLL